MKIFRRVAAVMGSEKFFSVFAAVFRTDENLPAVLPSQSEPEKVFPGLLQL